MWVEWENQLRSSSSSSSNGRRADVILEPRVSKSGCVRVPKFQVEKANLLLRGSEKVRDRRSST